MGKEKGHRGEYERKAQRQGQTDPHNRADIFYVTAAPVLSGENGGAACHTENEHEQDEEKLVRASDRGNRSLAQAADHEHVYEVERRGQQVLEKDGQNKREEPGEERFVSGIKHWRVSCTWLTVQEVYQD